MNFNYRQFVYFVSPVKQFATVTMIGRDKTGVIGRDRRKPWGDGFFTS